MRPHPICIFLFNIQYSEEENPHYANSNAMNSPLYYRSERPSCMTFDPPRSSSLTRTHRHSRPTELAHTYPRWVVLRKFLEGARESHLRCSEKARGQTVTSAVYKIFPQIKELQFGEGVHDDKEHHKDGGHLVNRGTKRSQQSTNKQTVGEHVRP